MALERIHIHIEDVHKRSIFTMDAVIIEESFYMSCQIRSLGQNDQCQYETMAYKG